MGGFKSLYQLLATKKGDTLLELGISNSDTNCMILVLNIKNIPNEYFLAVCESTGDTLLHKIAEKYKYDIEVFSKHLAKIKNCFTSEIEFIKFMEKENEK